MHNKLAGNERYVLGGPYGGTTLPSCDFKPAISTDGTIYFLLHYIRILENNAHNYYWSSLVK